MPDGGTIRVCARARSVGPDNGLDLAAGDYVQLAVEDEGGGIPQDLLERVTEPFFTTKEVGKGTGLGLSMVYGFARQSGGSLSIHSEEGEGTSVQIWLPRARSEPDAPAELAEAAVAGNARSLRILLVDDNEAVRATTAALLTDLGHKVETAEDGASMLRMLDADGGYDLIITDYAMPLMSGGEAMLKAREAMPDIPAIIVSGYADAEAIERKPEGVQVLGKPFSPQDMARAIARAVD
jgi:CheY-like chemotaxis protein